MSFQITTAFVESYRDGITLRRDQEMSRLRNLVTVETGVVGASHSRDFIGSRRPTKRTSRHADTILTDTPHERRWVDIETYDDADLIDKPDKVKMLSDPTNPYSTAMAQGMGREIDVVTSVGALGTTRTGVDGAGTSLNSDILNINTTGTALTTAKVMEAKRRFDEVDQPMDRMWAVSAIDLEDMLGDTLVTSFDQNSLKPLVQGEISTWGGFEWVRVEPPIMQETADPYRRTFCFVRDAVWLVFGIDVQGRISERDDKNYSTQVYYSMTLGAARLDDNGVQEWQTPAT